MYNCAGNAYCIMVTVYFSTTRGHYQLKTQAIFLCVTKTLTMLSTTNSRSSVYFAIEMMKPEILFRSRRINTKQKKEGNEFVKII